jgi:PKD repeat protein
MKKFLRTIFFILCVVSVRQAYSQTDTEFWFAVPKFSQGHQWDQKAFYFRFSNSGLANQITISMPANGIFAPIVINLAPNEVRTIDVTPFILQIWNENPNQIYNRGIRISATNLTTAYFEAGTPNNPDIYALKGRNALGTDFFVPFQDRFPNHKDFTPSPYSGIYIVATQDQTKITITPAQPVFPGRSAGIAFDTILNMGQSIAIVPDDYNNTGQEAARHLGGTRVQSTKPIAISTSDDSVVGSPGGCPDLIGDQIVPTSVIGNEYLVIRGKLTIAEYYYIVATESNTQVFIDGEIVQMMNRGQQLRMPVSAATHHVRTSSPVYVFHVTGFGCEQGGAILPPINFCTGSTRISFTRSKAERFFLNILVRAGAEDGFILNGTGPNTIIRKEDFKSIPENINWLYAEYELETGIIPVGIASLIENTKDVFHLGIINGEHNTGTMYGYFSDFNQLDLSANIAGTGNISNKCYGDPIQLIAHGGVSYRWYPPDFLDDPTSPTPIALPEHSIKYTVTVTGACRMTDSTSIFINLSNPVNAAFSLEESVGCSPFTVKVKNESFGVTNYSWRMGDGKAYTTSADEFTHTYINNTTEPIQRTLMLVGRNALFCRDTMITNVTVYPSIEANMTPDIVEGCSPLTVTFQNQSSVTASRFHWQFGDGASSSERHPTHTFFNFTNEEITYDVVLDAFSDNGCPATKTLQIKVKPFIEASFQFSPSVHCSPLDLELINTSFGATFSYWSFNNGQSFEPNSEKQFNRLFENNGSEPDTINIWLVTANAFGCSDTIARTLVILPGIQADFSSDVTEGCNPLPVTFTNLSTGAATFNWEFDQHLGNSVASNPQVLFNNPGTTEALQFNVRLTAISQHHCVDTISRTIIVYPRVEAGFTVDHFDLCTPQEVVFHNDSKGATSYLWNFGDGNVSESGSTIVSNEFINSSDDARVYTIKLTIGNQFGCMDSLSRNITIYPQVTAAFNMIESGCHPLEVAFENNSEGAAKYFWNFGDGGNSYLFDPKRVYENSSRTETETYVISLLVESKFGCRDSLSREITVYPKPLASYEISNPFGCTPLDVDFLDNSVGAVSLIWEFEHENEVSANPGNQFKTFINSTEQLQTYFSRLIAVNSFGCTDTISRGIEVYPGVETKIHVSDTEGCHPLDIYIGNSSLGATAATNYFWDYGDGNQSTSKLKEQTYRYNNFSHTEIRDFELKLLAESLYGCKDSVSMLISVFPKPLSSFEPLITEGCSPLDVAFSNASIGAQSYSWNYGDGATAFGIDSLKHRFHQAYDAGVGNYSVTLTVGNQFGCTHNTSKGIKVFPDITADFTSITEGCHPLNVEFSNLSDGVYTTRWNFGDGTTSNHLNPTYIFSNESNTAVKSYNVNLHTASVYGCHATKSALITVFPKPGPSFSINTIEGCAPLEIEINNQTIGASIYNWQLGTDISGENASVFKYTFQNKSDEPLSNLIGLKAINEFGCYRETSKNIVIYPEVKAGFVADNELMMGCNPLQLAFTNTSSRAHQFHWDFGDGNSSLLAGPENTYYTAASYATVYDVKLKAHSVYGCSDSIMHQAKVFPVPLADFMASPNIQVFPNTTIRVENLSTPGEWNFTWDMGDGKSTKTSSWETMEHHFEFPKNDYATRYFTISLKTSNDFCSDSISQQIAILAPHPAVSFEPAAMGCPPLEVKFKNETKYGKEFLWDFDDGNISERENPVHVFNTPGEYLVKLLVSGEGGMDSAYQTITVFEPPVADFRVSPSSIVQLPYDNVKMINMSSLASFYEWNMGDGTFYYEAEPEHLYSKAGTYDISLKISTNTFPQCHDYVLKANAVVAEENCRIIFPNAFTPDTSGPNGGYYITNDPSNHVFYPVHTGVKDYRLDIFSRWGEHLFSSDDVNIGWDGYYRGKLAQMGVYVWKVKATCHSGKKIEAAGDVTLYR